MAQVREKRLLELLQSDLRNLSNETKRKYPPVKEAAESAIMKIRTMSATIGKVPEQSSYLPSLQKSCSDLLQPFLMGCDTKSVSVIQLCFTSIQRLINHDIVDSSLSSNIVNVLWQIYDQGIDELQLRLLQTSLVLLSSQRSAVDGAVLSRALVLCFRLHFTKNDVTNHTAEATIRQVVALVFDRLVSEDKTKPEGVTNKPYVPKSSDKFSPPENVSSAVRDAYMLFQDLCQLVNADSPYWLVGITEMTRTFGLELLETVLSDYKTIFDNHEEFKFLLKDRVCALVIRLFSPNIKHRQGAPPPPSANQSVQEKPFFPISMRLLRVVSILLKKYYNYLTTECEIFLSLLLKFLDTDKPVWQRALAIEVLQQLCIQPRLLKAFCCAYDMQTHSTKIYRNLVSTLGTFIQNLMASYSANVAATNADILNGGVFASGSQTQYTSLNLDYKGTSIPLLPVSTVSSGKYLYREMLDKVEPPPVPDGYILGMAFYAFLDLIRGLTSMIDLDINEIQSKDKIEGCGEADKSSNTNTELKKVYKEMLDATWCGMLTVLSLLLDSSTDETTSEAVLKCIESCAAVCGLLENKAARDAFITILCKASLPVHYALPVFNASLAYLPQKIAIGLEQQQVLNSSLQQQVVAMGQPLVTNSNQISVMLTAKNMQCMRTVLNLAHCHGAVMNTAWQILLTTLQHLVWILGLKPTTGGQMMPNPRSSSDTTSGGHNTVLTTAVLTDLPVLSSTLSQLFEASRNLDDVALHHLINALCSLSLEAMDAAYSNNVKEPSLFAIAKLLETGLVNMFRIEILWRPVSGHLLEVCQHPNAILREWGAEGVTSLVKSAISFKHDMLLSENPRMLHMFLHPLKEICNVPHTDVKQKQLDVTLQILHSSGDTLASGWLDVLSIIVSPTDTTEENLIRTGFRSLQLIVSDFLPSMPCHYLAQCVNVVTKYGLQAQEFNISLTAIGLLWSVSDYMFQNREKIGISLSQTKEDDSIKVNSMDELWLDLFAKIGELCVDSRPAIRKSAGQTLFSTISTHGSILSTKTWNRVMWDVLFVLMDNVQSSCDAAPSERKEVTILMHHSRDTAQKQWQETLVLTLAGLSRIFKLKRSVLAALPNFSEAWERLFEYLEHAALCPSSEVSGAAMCSFEDVLMTDMGAEPENKNAKMWIKAWETWSSIGIKVTEPPSSDVTDLDTVISQAYLTSYISLFSTLHKHIQSQFSIQDFNNLTKVLDGAIRIPVRWDAAAFELPSLSSFRLTPLQDVIIRSINVVQKGISLDSDTAMYPAIFSYLLKNASYATTPPSYGEVSKKLLSNGKPKWQCANCAPFAEYSIGLAVELYKKTACHKAVIQHDVLTAIIISLQTPLSNRYDENIKSTWQLAVDALVHVLQTGMPVVRQHSQSSHFEKLWDELFKCIEVFLFPPSSHPKELSIEDRAMQEKLDIKIVQLLHEEVLPHSSCIPKTFTAQIIDLLNKGSAHQKMEVNSENIGSNRAREGFSQACFDTLLQFSLVKNPESKTMTNGGDLSVVKTSISDINELTMDALIKRCRASLISYIEEDRLSLRRPLPQQQINDCMRLLQSIDTLFGSIMESSHSIDQAMWNQITDLYPVLVNCITCSSLEFRTKVAKILMRYKTLLNTDSLT